VLFQKLRDMVLLDLVNRAALLLLMLLVASFAP
jgi:hypothetical protein